MHKSAPSSFNFIDLFAGIGGFRLALNSLGGECVFSSEIDEKASETYKLNFGELPFGDIRDITGVSKLDSLIGLMIPDHDILAAGFPCQPFSRAGVSARTSLGKSHGFLDQVQGTLFFDICRIVSVKRPRVVFLENVSNIVGHDKGKTFETIREILEDKLGYKFFSAILNSETLVPQRRKRCFIVAFRDSVATFQFPDFKGDPIPLKSILEPVVDSKYTISDRSWEGHKRRTKNNVQRGTGFTAYEADLNRPSNTLVARYYKDGKECLVPQPGSNPRLLTPRECARLQGFPENYKVHPTRSAAYKQFGNSVSVPVVKAVAEKILETLGSYHGGRQINQREAVAEHGRDQRQKYEAGNGRAAGFPWAWSPVSAT